MKIHSGGTSISVAVRENLGAFETGQMIAFANGYPTIHSCEEEVNIFARQIRQAFAALGTRPTPENPADDPSVDLSEIGAPELARE